MLSRCIHPSEDFGLSVVSDGCVTGVRLCLLSSVKMGEDMTQLQLNPSSVKVVEEWLTPNTRQGKQYAASFFVEYSNHGRPLYQLLLNDCPLVEGIGSTAVGLAIYCSTRDVKDFE